MFKKILNYYPMSGKFISVVLLSLFVLSTPEAYSQVISSMDAASVLNRLIPNARATEGYNVGEAILLHVKNHPESHSRIYLDFTDSARLNISKGPTENGCAAVVVTVEINQAVEIPPFLYICANGNEYKISIYTGK